MGHNILDLAAVSRLADGELMAGLQGLVQQDRALTARLLLHLGEVEARGLFRDCAFSSMFEYAVEALHMSSDEAYVRLRAAKLAREFPLVLQMLERNELHLTAIKLLAPHLTQANHVDVLERAARGHLELHHEDPYARGGPPTVQNLRLLCRSHNALLAERDFGRAYMQRKRRRARAALGPERPDQFHFAPASSRCMTRPGAPTRTSITPPP